MKTWILMANHPESDTWGLEIGRCKAESEKDAWNNLNHFECVEPLDYWVEEAKVMKVFYLNDREVPAKIFLTDLHKLEKTLAPAQGQFFEIEMPQDHSPYIKIWETNVVLLGSIKSDAEPDKGI